MDIVVGALSGMVDALPGKLGALLEQEYALLSGVRGDVGFLQTELTSMRAAIQHCESLDHPDTTTTAWVRRVRELAYDIEDWVDLFAIRVDAGAGGDPASTTSSRIFGWFRRGVDRVTTIPARHAIATELKELKERVVELSAQRKRYSLGPLALPAVPRPVDPRMAALFVEPGSLVGLDGPVEEVSNLVMDAGGQTGLKVISIVGMAGSGKTTLARALCRRLGEQNCFQCHAFVSVGQKPSIISKTLTDMLAQFGGGHRGGEDIGQLIGSLRDSLEKKRYLVVVDDLWSREHWSTIKCCFPENSLGSRIITTTRNAALATECSFGSDECVYKIGLLTEDDSKILFQKKAFGNGHGCPQHLKAALDQIIRKCGGLPLAVGDTAAKLAHKQSRDEWEKLGLNLLSSSDSDGMKEILNLSYNDLPLHLKACLLYLSIFPENREIDIGRLVRRWIAEGFITGARGVSMEETARSYLSELISRNMVQPLHPNHDGIPTYCSVQPVMHDFIVCKSMEENFATLVGARHQDVSTSNSTIRRLSLQNSSKQDQPAARNESTDLSHSRSITIFGHASTMPRLDDLKVVRVLDLEGYDGQVCLDGLCKLLLLRYLSLRGTDVSELPAQIGDLRCLETLDVRSTKVKELPPSIVRLEKLTHLLAGSAKLPGGITKLKALQTLSCQAKTKSSVDVIQEINGLANLRELELSGDEKEVMFPGDGFRSLKQLYISCSSPLVTFEPSALPMVQELKLTFEKGLADGSSSVSGIENLSNLKHLFVKFSQHDAGAMATVNAARNAAQAILPNRPEITLTVAGRNY